ncbi:MAG TPA: glycosyltransferase WbuB [Anaerolineae bacterium]|nr:glycosyltransferase WbuB [Anaerolineae bacterium]
MNRKKKVSIFCANLSSNALGRAYLLARVLQRDYEVEVLGPTFGAGIWPPCDTGEFTYQTVPGCNFPCFFLSMRELLHRARGDVIYAVKPRLSSFGVGLLIKWTRGTPLVLDIDDWDLEGEYTIHCWRRVLGLARLYNPYANAYLHLLERFFPVADAITTVSTMLQQRFGGVLVPHGRDTDYLNPARYSGRALRQKWGLDDRKIVMFLGTPRPHKGLEDLIAALHTLTDLQVTLVIVGVDWSDPYTDRLAALGATRVRLLGMQPFTEIPRFLAAADIVALPQRDVPFARAQVPAKIFDAMAMARPVVATAVGDLPQILEGCGLIVPPGDVSALTEAIRRLVLNAPLAEELGRRARQRCIERYSWDVMEQTLQELFQNLLSHRHA